MARKRTKVLKQTPAAAVMDIFGNGAELARLLGKDRTTVYRWDMPREAGGTAGRIPSKAQNDILELAQRMKKPEITPELLLKGRTIEVAA